MPPNKKEVNIRVVKIKLDNGTEENIIHEFNKKRSNTTRIKGIISYRVLDY